MALPLPMATQAALQRSLARYTGQLGARLVGELTDRLVGGVASIVNPQQERRVDAAGNETWVTVGKTPAEVRAEITRLLDRFQPETVAEEMNLDFKVEVAESVARGAGRHVSDNYDQEEVDAYPALELLRVYDRTVPRGFERRRGVLFPVPGDDWPTRFRAAAQAVGDTAALGVLDRTGRMMALKASPVWQALGDGVGGYQDTLGNPYPPFAFNSGYDQDAVAREECEALGLLAPGQRAPRAAIDFDHIFAEVTA